MSRLRYLMVSVDTEGDDQWDDQKKIGTNNARFIMRFQKLCEKYRLKPVYLTDYEMANDPVFVSEASQWKSQGNCEIGMHLHAWYTPPEANLSRINQERDFLVEYPEDVMARKIDTMTELLTAKFGERPVTHRSGRWVTDERYLKLIAERGYRIDCSVTPHVNWCNVHGSTGMPGCDYSGCSEKPYFMDNGILEIPVTIRKMHIIEWSRIHSFRSAVRELHHFVDGTEQWLRLFDTDSSDGIRALVRKLKVSDQDYLFMIHSSELMPGGSPAFRTEKDVDKLYEMIEFVFHELYSCGWIGITMRDYLDQYNRDI